MPESYGDPFSAEGTQPPAFGRQGKAAIKSDGMKGPVAGAVSTLTLLLVQHYFPDLEAAQVTAVASIFISLFVAGRGRWKAKAPITSIF